MEVCIVVFVVTIGVKVTMFDFQTTHICQQIIITIRLIYSKVTISFFIIVLATICRAEDFFFFGKTELICRSCAFGDFVILFFRLIGKTPLKLSILDSLL